VAVTAGETQFTRMPSRATSRASDFENATTAALAPAYTASPHPPTRAVSDAIEMITPPPGACASAGSAARHPFSTPT